MTEHFTLVALCWLSLHEDADLSNKISSIRYPLGLKNFVSQLFRFPDRQIGWYKFAVARAIGLIRGHKPDIIYTSGNPWTTHLVGYTLSRLFNKPWVADFRDPWTENPYKEQRHKLFEKMDQYLESRVVRQSSCVICNTKPLLNKMRKMYCSHDPKKFVHISNGFLAPLFEGLEYDKYDMRLVITHAGTLYSKRSPLSLLQAVSNLRKRGILTKENFVLKLLGKNEFDEIRKNILPRLDICELVELCFF